MKSHILASIIIAAFGAALLGTPARTFADEPVVDKTEEASPEAKAVLEALEAAGKNLKTIKCAVSYATDDKLNVTTTKKTGTIQFKRAEPHPMFLIAFNKTFADGIKVAGDEWWLFRDRWLAEAKSKSTMIIRRELLAPGEQVDLFNLEKSPIPMPFGQTKQEVLDNFHVKLMPPQMGDPPNTDHLYCKPRDGNQLSREYRRMEYYVSRETHLPVRIVAEDEKGDEVNVADFKDLDGSMLTSKSINQDIPDTAFTLPAETVDYHVSTEPLQSQAAAPRQGDGIGSNLP